MFRIACIAIGYLFGCILTADLLVWHKKRQHIQSLGSKNPGMANVASQFGWKYGAAVLAGDLVKTVAACAVSCWLFPDMGREAVLYGGVGAMLGHNWPFWNRFKGGKGIAVIGAASVLFYPPVGVASYLAGALAVLFTGYLCIGSAVIGISLPLFTWLTGFSLEEILVMAVVGAILCLRHRSNFVRILHGQEKRTLLLNRVHRKKGTPDKN